jgi:hypothetical protein
MNLLSNDHIKYMSSFLSPSTKIILRHTSIKFICLKIEHNEDIVDDATIYDNPALISYLKSCNYTLTPKVFWRAIYFSSLNILKWCIEGPGSIYGLVPSKLDKNVVEHAVNVEVLDYLIKNEYDVSERAVISAIKNKNMDMIKRLVKDFKVTTYLLTHAIKSQNISVISCIFDKIKSDEHLVDGYYISNEYVMEISCSTGNLEIVKWFEEKSFTLVQRDIYTAIDSGSIEMIEYVLSKGFKIPFTYLYQTAVVNGFLHILNWAIDKYKNSLDKYDYSLNIIHYIPNPETEHTIPVLEWLLAHNYSFKNNDINRLKNISNNVKVFLRSRGLCL